MPMPASVIKQLLGPILSCSFLQKDDIVCYGGVSFQDVKNGVLLLYIYKKFQWDPRMKGKEL